MDTIKIDALVMNEMAKRHETLDSRFHLMVFKEPSGGLVFYDTTSPADCYKSVLNKHPDYTFVATRPVDSVETVKQVRNAYKLVGGIERLIRSTAELRAQFAKAA